MSEDLIQIAYSIVGLPQGTPLDQVLRKLKDLRIAAHPDKHPSRNNDDRPAEEFTKIDACISAIENARVANSVSVLAHAGASTLPAVFNPPTSDHLFLAISELREAKAEIAKLQSEVMGLQKELKSERDSKREAELARLAALYEPRRSQIVGATATIAVTTTIAILGKIDESATLLQRYSPVPVPVLHAIVFSVLAAAIVATILLLVRNAFFKSMTEEVTTTFFASGFVRHLRHDSRSQGDQSRPNGFTEGMAARYIREFFSPNDYFFVHPVWPRSTKTKEELRKELPFVEWWRIAKLRLAYIAKYVSHPKYTTRLLLGLLSPTATDHLKDMFIFHLIQRRLVDSPRVQGLGYYFELLSLQQSPGIPKD